MVRQVGFRWSKQLCFMASINKSMASAFRGGFLGSCSFPRST